MAVRDDWDDPRGAEVYAESVREGELYRELAIRLLDAADVRAPGGALLDLATGSGVVLSRAAARLGASARLVGTDRSRAMLRLAGSELSLAPAALVAADPAALPFGGGTFDAVTCSAALWHFPAVGRALAEAARVVRRGGRVAFNVPCAQLDDVEDGEPPPLLRALAAAGTRRFGTPPAPGGPVLGRARLLAACAEAGLEPHTDASFDVLVRQEELAGLLAVPAVGRRMYPDATRAEFEAFVADACAAVEPGARVPVRWWQAAAVRR